MLREMANRGSLRLVPALDKLDAREDAQVARAIAAMKAEPSRRWTVAALGRIAGMSRATLARRFARVVGVSPLRWLAEHRLAMAEQLLADTDLPLAAIAGRVGYRCEFAFAKAFKRVAGLPPGVFRRLARVARVAGVSSSVSVFRAAA